MYLIYSDERIHYINHFHCKKIWRRDYYDCFGFLSCTQFLSQVDSSVTQIIYYRQNATVALIKDYIYSDANKVSGLRIQVISNNGSLICVFNSEAELVFYALSLFFKK